jgi:hypothetical protein
MGSFAKVFLSLVVISVASDTIVRVARVIADAKIEIARAQGKEQA